MLQLRVGRQPFSGKLAYVLAQLVCGHAFLAGTDFFGSCTVIQIRCFIYLPSMCHMKPVVNDLASIFARSLSCSIFAKVSNFVPR